MASPPPPPARRRHNAPSARRPGPLSPRVRWKPYTENRSDRQNDEPNGRRPLRDRSSRIRRRKASVISTQNDQLAARDAQQHGEAMGLRTALQQKTIFATPKQRPKSRTAGAETTTIRGKASVISTGIGGPATLDGRIVAPINALNVLGAFNLGIRAMQYHRQVCQQTNWRW